MCPATSDYPRVVGCICDGAGMPDRYVLRGTELRYCLTRLLQLQGQSSVTELVAALDDWNFTVPGRPTKTVSDALRWEMRRDRVRRRGRGRYSAAGMPRGTEHRIITRVQAMREAAESLVAGHNMPHPGRRGG